MNEHILDSGHFRVSDIHELYFEVYGNPNGIPIVFLHGGPGAGFWDSDQLFFDPKVFKVLFFDQRGASRSKPFGSVQENTTQDLISDINKLIDYTGFTQFHLFGGSWGSTLALVYAIQFPEHVLGMCLRGIFLGDSKSITHFLNGGLKTKHPKIWERFESLVPEANRQNIAGFYLDKMLNGTPQEMEQYAYEWAFYEISIFKKNITATEVHKRLETISYKSLAILEAHYLGNRCFLEDNYILNNTHKISKIPTHLIHGKHDDICPVEFAQELHKKIPKATFKILDAGHSASEPEITKALFDHLKIISAEVL